MTPSADVLPSSEILGANYSLSFTTAIEAPFSLALEPKLPLWKYLMVHDGKTLLRILKPSGIKVWVAVAKKVHMCPGIHPKKKIEVFIFILSLLIWSYDGIYEESLFHLCLGMFFWLLWRTQRTYSTLDQ